jgi:hypothetical protein
MVNNKEILNSLMEEACRSGADKDNPYMKLLHIIMDLEYRIKVLETKPDPIPMFSGIPITPIINFMTENGRREKIGPPLVEASKKLNENERSIYNHLVSKGCNWEDAAAIAREIEEINHGE